MLEILHIASFSGNIGDNANHKGFRQKLEKAIDRTDINYTELEIRKFYQNYNEEDKCRFDIDFLKIANKSDYVIIGGGNFFEIWIESSETGTTIDISKEIIDKINTPILFFGLGFDPYKGVPVGNIAKFKNFIDNIINQGIHTVSVRNDGSIKHIKKYLGENYLTYINHVPDGGFFLQIEEKGTEVLNLKSRYIAINIAKDMSDLRFLKMDNGIDYETFIFKFYSLVDKFLINNNEIDIVFVPHIYSDLEAIYDVLSKLKDKHKRNRVSVAPLLHGDGSEQIIFNIYKNAELALGMRFHTNVCSIGLNTPTIGLVSYPKLYDLYEELGLLDRLVHVNMGGFPNKLYEMIIDSLKNKKQIEKRYQKLQTSLELDISCFFEKMDLTKLKN